MKSPWIQLIVPATLVIGWEFGAHSGAVDQETFSRPSAILAAAFEAAVDGSLLLATWETLQAAAYGLALASVVGFFLGIFLGLQSSAESISRPLMEVLRSIPAIAFVPLAVLVFGFGTRMEGMIVAYACVWPILVATLGATRNMNPRLLEVAAALEMSPGRKLLSIIVPAVLSRVAVGFRTAIGFALVVSVTVEILINPRGLGYGLILAQQSFRPDLMYAYLVWLGVLGFLVNEVSKLSVFTFAGAER